MLAKYVVGLGVAATVPAVLITGNFHPNMALATATLASSNKT
jgi:hypothetical protein